MSENINELVNGVISTKKLEGAEIFKNAEGSPLAAADILDYWSWAYSDIVGNTNRGALAIHSSKGNRFRASGTQ